MSTLRLGDYRITQSHRAHNWLLRALWEPKKNTDCDRLTLLPAREVTVQGFLSSFFLSGAFEGEAQGQCVSSEEI